MESKICLTVACTTLYTDFACWFWSCMDSSTQANTVAFGTDLLQTFGITPYLSCDDTALVCLGIGLLTLMACSHIYLCLSAAVRAAWCLGCTPWNMNDRASHGSSYWPSWQGSLASILAGVHSLQICCWIESWQHWTQSHANEQYLFGVIASKICRLADFRYTFQNPD